VTADRPSLKFEGFLHEHFRFALRMIRASGGDPPVRARRPELEHDDDQVMASAMTCYPRYRELIAPL
jgi:hypothetical protein